ncbi:MAG TPA: sigma-54-dependent Fis family transcriptional regulator [Candidatus Aminicenantes bacterium]|nr:sigma-54-dependent Fis family transcriptional regulator [Candidatus Aminicenantes bacterium]HEB34769.1 sigma-54-dependent Fis family transcriptional regulator [Candidatus Aminicenantes bacterium]
MAREKILVIDDEPDIGWLFSKILSEEGYKVLISLNGEEGISKIKKEKPDLVFLDLKLPGMDGMEILQEIRTFNKDLLVIVLTAYETVKTAVEAMKLGAVDYLSKPVNIDRIKTTIKNAIRTQTLIKDAVLRKKTTEKIDFDRIIGDSLQVKDVLDLVKKAAPHDITVLLRGASGTGKELIARAIHNSSGRADKPFVAIDCAILPDTLVESEIFGHEKGAFTGANEKKLGKFELAQEGTVFLDEIGNLTPQIQVKLLRTLQEREIERLGGKKPIRVDVRIIAATNMNLEKDISAGRFREDLYYRLNVFSIYLPPLRERDGDVMLLTEYFLKESNRIFKKEVKKISPEVINLLAAYSWPGNVRELRNVIESSVLLASDSILPQHMPLKIQEVLNQSIELQTTLKKVGKQAKCKAEKELIMKVLKEVNWNKSKASKLLKVDYKTLYNKIKEYNIERT